MLKIATCVAAAGIFAAGCSTAPPAIRDAQPGPLVDAVRADPNRYLGQPVRWGGSIAKVENRTDETWLQVVARPLYTDGQPIDTTVSYGRFLAKARGFVEPTLYKEGRDVTVVGKVQPSVTLPIGSHQYSFAVVSVDTMYLWPEQYYEPYPYYYDPWPYYWDPFYSPWWYYRGYNYYPPRYYPRPHPSERLRHPH